MLNGVKEKNSTIDGMSERVRVFEENRRVWDESYRPLRPTE